MDGSALPAGPKPAGLRCGRRWSRVFVTKSPSHQQESQEILVATRGCAAPDGKRATRRKLRPEVLQAHLPTSRRYTQSGHIPVKPSTGILTRYCTGQQRALRRQVPCRCGIPGVGSPSIAQKVPSPTRSGFAVFDRGGRGPDRQNGQWCTLHRGSVPHIATYCDFERRVE